LGRKIAEYAASFRGCQKDAGAIMRILLLNDRIPPENRGGAGEVFWRLALALCDMGHEVHVIAATKEASFEEIRETIPTYHIHINYPERLRAWLSLYNPQIIKPLQELYQVIKPDIINAHNIHADLSYHSLSIAHKMGIPTVFSSHDVMPFAYQKLSFFIDPNYCGVRSPKDYRLPTFFNLRQMRLRYNPLRNLTIRRILSHCQARTAPSQELCNAHAANDLPVFRAVHNGIDAAKFSASAETIKNLRQRLNLQGRKVILFAGRLTAAKGTKQLLEALELVVKSVPQTILLVLSSVPIEEQIQDAKYSHLREKHIISGGWLAGEELAAAYHLADLLVSPSIIFDTFPTVNLEAMATKTVVLASCYGGSREAILDGETGYIINPFDTADFAQKMTTLLKDDLLRQKMAEAAYQRLIQHFSIEKQANEMIAIFQEAIYHGTFSR
jgi:glycosyltransferase involved in cell wall biosynthesis